MADLTIEKLLDFLGATEKILDQNTSYNAKESMAFEPDPLGPEGVQHLVVNEVSLKETAKLLLCGKNKIDRETLLDVLNPLLHQEYKSMIRSETRTTTSIGPHYTPLLSAGVCAGAGDPGTVLPSGDIKDAHAEDIDSYADDTTDDDSDEDSIGSCTKSFPGAAGFSAAALTSIATVSSTSRSGNKFLTYMQKDCDHFLNADTLGSQSSKSIFNPNRSRTPCKESSSPYHTDTRRKLILPSSTLAASLLSTSATNTKGKKRKEEDNGKMEYLPSLGQPLTKRYRKCLEEDHQNKIGFKNTQVVNREESYYSACSSKGDGLKDDEKSFQSLQLNNAILPTARKKQKLPLTVATEEGYKKSTEGKRFRPYHFDQWKEKFQELVQFRTMHGHCLVPHHFPENQALAQWVKRQRYQHKLRQRGNRSTLTEERQFELEQLGFVWDSHQAIWDERFQELKGFKAKFGHCNVPCNYADQTLAIWVKCQRRQYKLYQEGSRSSMTQERFNQLEFLGFNWNPRKLMI